MPLPFADEDEYQTWIIVTARNRGWKVFWLPSWMYRLAMASMKRMRRGDRMWPDKGWPDLILLRGHYTDDEGRQHEPEILVLEVKTESGRTSPEQREWLSDFQAVGIDARVVRPQDRAYLEERLAA